MENTSKSNHLFLLFLSLMLPFVNWAGFLYLGRKTGQKKWVVLAYVICILIFIAFLVTLLFSDWYSNNPQNSVPFITYITVMGSCSLVMVALWVLPSLYILINKKEVVQRITFASSQQSNETLPQDHTWRKKNTRFLYWMLIAPLSGIVLVHMGLRDQQLHDSQQKGVWMFVIGVISLICGLIISNMGVFAIYATSLVWLFNVIIPLFLLAISIVHSIINLPGYLGRRNLTQQSQLAQYPCLNDRAWLMKNSLYMLWCLIPYAAPAALIQTGLVTNKRKWWIAGGICVLVNVALIAVGRLNREWVSTFIADSIFRILFIEGLSLFAACTAIREPYLLARAKAYNGYATSFEYEQKAQERFREAVTGHAAQEKKNPEASMPVRRASQKPTSSDDTPALHAKPATDVPMLDLNRCTEAELLSLPGLDIASAKRALAYREKNGGFQDVDEFIAAMKIKPHFAVQILELAIASPIVRKTNGRAESSIRPLDF